MTLLIGAIRVRAMWVHGRWHVRLRTQVLTPPDRCLRQRRPELADPDPGRSAAVIAYVIEETVRQAANFPTVIVRQDWLLGVIAVQQVQLFCRWPPRPASR